jgi:hypothetical protein
MFIVSVLTIYNSVALYQNVWIAFVTVKGTAILMILKL